MSTIYNLEPPTKGKVVLKTSLGDIDVELWPKEAPQAVRNFVQLCLEGYYNDTVFFRVIKDFLAQAGDPTGTGTGGESIYGAPFKDEFHSRLKFSHRGLVACANENRLHSNGSQFFITLEPVPHLDKKNTIFGKVTGDSIYNVAHFSELVTDDNDRPLEPPRILGADVLWNPFEDIVPRSTEEEREAEAVAQREREAEQLKREKKKRKKNLGLLSFGEEAQDEDMQAAAVAADAKIRSAFDAVQNDPRLAKEGTELARQLAEQEAIEETERKRLRASVKTALSRKDVADEEEPAEAQRDLGQAEVSVGEVDDEVDEDDFASKMRAKVMAKRKAHERHTARPETTAVPKPAKEGEEDNSDEAKRKRLSVRRLKEEAQAAGKLAPARVKVSKQVAKQDTGLLSEMEKKRAENKERKRLTKNHAKDNAARLEKFRSKMKGMRGAAAAPQTAGEDHAQNSEEGYNGKAKEGEDRLLPAAWRVDEILDYQDEGFGAMLAHRLAFPKEADKRDPMAMDDEDNLMVIDPMADRNESWSKREGGAKRRHREWDANKERPT